MTKTTKSILIVLALFIGVIISSEIGVGCGSTTPDKEFTHQKADTIREVAIFISNLKTLDLSLDYIWRVEKDTFTVEKVDTVGSDLVAKRKWLRDTIYYIPQFAIATDSAGKQIIDTVTKKPKQIINFVPADKSIIQYESNKNLIPLFNLISQRNQQAAQTPKK